MGRGPTPIIGRNLIKESLKYSTASAVGAIVSRPHWFVVTREVVILTNGVYDYSTHYS